MQKLFFNCNCQISRNLRDVYVYKTMKKPVVVLIVVLSLVAVTLASGCGCGKDCVTTTVSSILTGAFGDNGSGQNSGSTNGPSSGSNNPNNWNGNGNGNGNGHVLGVSQTVSSVCSYSCVNYFAPGASKPLCTCPATSTRIPISFKTTGSCPTFEELFTGGFTPLDMYKHATAFIDLCKSVNKCKCQPLSRLSFWRINHKGTRSSPDVKSQSNPSAWAELGK
jgi:hypothetical protein